MRRVHHIAEALTRVVQRFRQYDSAKMPTGQWHAYRAWQRARHTALCREYAAEINRCDNIIGKQWHYDNTANVHLPPEHGSG